MNIKHRFFTARRLAAILCLLAGLLFPLSGSAQVTNFFTGNGDGVNWSDPDNWSGAVPDGTDVIVDLQEDDVTIDTTDRTVGTIRKPGGYGWTHVYSSGGAKLILDVSSGRPVINDSGGGGNNTFEIHVVLDGTKGVRIEGSSKPVNFYGINTYSGNTLIEGNRLSLKDGGSLATCDITIESGATLKGDGSGGVLNYNVDGTNSDLITVDGTFEIGGLTLAVNMNEPKQYEYVVADYSGSGTISGSNFLSVTGLPKKWLVDYAGTEDNTNCIVVFRLPPPGMTLLIR